MSRNNPIPVRLREAFAAHMDANDMEDLPDGAWFHNLEQSAHAFIKKHNLRFADANSAAHQYLRMRNEEPS